MARIRSIKPEFFRNEALFEAERKAGLPLRLAFAGLWTAADREGRFRWRPRQLKLDALPYDEIDFVAVLDALASGGFIVRYVIGEEVFGAIPSWSRHQVINNREAASDIPEPPADACTTLAERVADACGTRAALVADACGTRAALVVDACGTPLVHAQVEGKGREGKGKGKEGEAPAVVVDAAPPPGPPAAPAKHPPRALTVAELVADGLTAETAAEWLAHRKRKAALLTPRAWEGIKAEVRRSGLSTEAAMLKALARGWTGFEAAWSGVTANSRQPPAATADRNAEARRLLGFAEQGVVDA